jgi:hypothetical protein
MSMSRVPGPSADDGNKALVEGVAVTMTSASDAAAASAVTRTITAEKESERRASSSRPRVLIVRTIIVQVLMPGNFRRNTDAWASTWAPDPKRTRLANRVGGQACRKSAEPKV